MVQVLLHDIHVGVMTLSETFQVAAIIEKLHPSLGEFKNYLKNKQKHICVEDLVVRLCIEEGNKPAQRNIYTPDYAKANMVDRSKDKNDGLILGLAVENGEKMYMGNAVAADIKGEGDVILKVTSEKEIKLTNVLYILEIRKYLVSGWLLNKFRFRLVI
ncbi:hypothetical protein Tco_0633714 [Tanacetum coccineum]